MNIKLAQSNRVIALLLSFAIIVGLITPPTYAANGGYPQNQPQQGQYQPQQQAYNGGYPPAQNGGYNPNGR